MNILKAHRFARRMSKDELLLEETAPLLNTLAGLELGAAAIDIARLNQKFKAEANGATLEEFLRAELAEVVGRRGAPSALRRRRLGGKPPARSLPCCSPGPTTQSSSAARARTRGFP